MTKASPSSLDIKNNNNVIKPFKISINCMINNPSASGWASKPDSTSTRILGQSRVTSKPSELSFFYFENRPDFEVIETKYNKLALTIPRD